MTTHTFDVLGIGNAIVDIISQCDDAFLAKHDAPKGHMRLVDDATVTALYDDMGSAIEVSGGSAANTIAGVASFGGAAAFIGKVADDEFGRIFRHDLKAIGVNFPSVAAPAGGEPTARSLILVTPDGQRTMNTFLGVSPLIEAQDLDTDTISASGIVYLEGYLFDRQQAKDAFAKANALAKAAGRKVALTLSDGFCVDRHRDDFLKLIRDDVDILFANEDELLSLFETTDFEAAFARAGEIVPILAATRSEKGSVLKAGDQRVAVSAIADVTVVDTTGAGDLYAAGVLTGIARGLALETAGRLGSLAAAEVISHIGARPRQALKDLAAADGIML